MSRNGSLIPESKQALQNFKYEVANSLNVDLIIDNILSFSFPGSLNY